MDLVCAEASVLKFCLEGEASFGNEVCWRDISRKILYLLLHRRIDNENWSKIEGILDSFAQISKGLVPFSIRHVLCMFKYNALTSLRQYLWLYPTRNTVRMLRVELVFTMINGLKRMTDRLFTYVAIRYYYVVSRLKRHFSLSRRTKLNQKKNKSDTFTLYVFRIHLIYLMICDIEDRWTLVGPLLYPARHRPLHDPQFPCQIRIPYSTRILIKGHHIGLSWRAL